MENRLARSKIESERLSNDLQTQIKATEENLRKFEEENFLRKKIERERNDFEELHKISQKVLENKIPPMEEVIKFLRFSFLFFFFF